MDGKKTEFKQGDVAKIGAGQMHGIMGLENLQIVEVQLGWELSEDDIIRSDFIWKNNPCASFPSLASDSSRMPPCIPSTEFRKF